MIRKIAGYTIAMAVFLTLSLGILCSVIAFVLPVRMAVSTYACATAVLLMCVCYRASFARLVMRFEAFAENGTLIQHEEACGLYAKKNVL
jgi:hypothetical protein